MKPTYEQLESEVLAWGNDRGILDKATPMTQAIKTLEEVAELIEAINKGDLDEQEDALGDILVTIILGAELAGFELKLCLESALNVIQKRTGKMVNGIFVKDGE
jgi:NTP pyrophosphatase (non-canonical NTP hydrolase)